MIGKKDSSVTVRENITPFYRPIHLPSTIPITTIYAWLFLVYRTMQGEACAGGAVQRRFTGSG